MGNARSQERSHSERCYSHPQEVMAFWKALRRFWYIPILAVGGIIAWILFCRWRPGSKLTPLSTTVAELEAIKAGAEADKVRVELGTVEAVKHINEKYAGRIAKLNEKQKVRAEKLLNDPEALARFIVRGTEP